MITELEKYWEDSQPFLKNAFTPVVYESWIAPLEPVKIIGNTFILKTSGAHFKEVLEQRYLQKITTCIKAATEKDFKVQISTKENAHEPIETDVLSKKQNISTSDYTTNLKKKYIFESFVRGKSNALAFAAAVAVAEAPGKTSFNPLFLYGGVGLGKTHLMHSIGNFIIEENSSAKVLYTSSENFTNELITSIRKDRNQEFRNKYRDIDILLIDDIQFLSDKEGTQEEFFHTFNTLYDASKQIVISSDQPPIQLKTLEERLRSRFGSGLIVDITLPDFETRTAILEKKAELDNLKVPKDVLKFIAKNIISNIRELEGALNKVAAYAKLSNTKITMDLAEKALHDLMSESSKRDVTSEYIQEVVAEYYNLTAEALRSKKRNQKITYARHIAMYLCRKMMPDSLSTIGSKFGGRDHTTIIHGCNKISDEVETNEDLKHVLIELERQIMGK